ncbi:Peptidase family M48 [Cruoricaptor ignavus]|uniref:Peptidase family M48 n=1 Tax=Cruoricaptor ignavus TaxID=1118202 RepID=A0A1M6ASW4_9FLAO|nr:M48 family metallopeptidase [Cruoricaptor ignavus]SHI39555.1 Peptidase family M48 [Cruoricaptor ignavus]
MKKIKAIAMGAAAFATVACTTNPVTGRRSLQMVSNQQINAMAFQQYRQTLSESKVITNTAASKQVNNVGLRIKNAAENYYRSIGRSSDLQDYNWEFNLIDENQMNAWCMPGGKVAVYTGILPVTKNDTGLAVVLGHEVSHALAGHGNERISQAMLAQYGGAIAGSTISSAAWQQVFQAAYPIGSQVVLLRYGRSQELEADQMGLYLMSMAGYDPREAVPFWQRMEAASGGQRAPEFLSTHPNPGNRVKDIEKNLPRALEYYKASGGKI